MPASVPSSTYMVCGWSLLEACVILVSVRLSPYNVGSQYGVDSGYAHCVFRIVWTKS